MTSKRSLALAVVAISLLAACKDKPAEKAAAIHITDDTPKTDYSITGSWTGLFEHDTEEKRKDEKTGEWVVTTSNKITLFIDQMLDGSISGRSVCAGNERAFEGIYTEDGDKIEATLKEPGDHKNDGTFTLVISKSDKTLTGKWKPINGTSGGRHYTLERKNFKYEASHGQHPEVSTRLLTQEDVNNKLKDELRFMRNEVYARHGYCFKLPEMREQFEGFDWYMPVSTDVRKKLTSIEVKNEVLIKHFEQYAEESYDDFGR